MAEARRPEDGDFLFECLHFSYALFQRRLSQLEQLRLTLNLKYENMFRCSLMLSDRFFLLCEL